MGGRMGGWGNTEEEDSVEVRLRVRGSREMFRCWDIALGTFIFNSRFFFLFRPGNIRRLDVSSMCFSLFTFPPSNFT